MSRHFFYTGIILCTLQSSAKPAIAELKVGHLIALRTETEEEAPWIGKVTAVNTDDVRLVWLEGTYTGKWKVAKVRSGRKMIEWHDSVQRTCIMLYGFELTSGFARQLLVN